MRPLAVLQSAVIVMLLGSTVPGAPQGAVAQEATPAVQDFTPEGITFEPVAFTTGLVLPETGELSQARVTFEPGAGFDIEEGELTYALAVVESGELTIRFEAPLVVTRAGALEAAVAEAEVGGAFVPETEVVPARHEVTVRSGDAVLFPPIVGGEVGNAGQERTVVLVTFVGPPAAEGTPTAGEPAVDESATAPPTELTEVEEGTVVAATPAP